MKLGLAGLGRMGGNMARRLRRGGIEVVGFNRGAEVTDGLVAEAGITAAYSLEELVAALPSPRVLWLMLPAGEITEQSVCQALTLLAPGDVLVDGANSFYKDSVRRAGLATAAGVHYVDAGVSGGIWGLENGYALMVGGSAQAFSLLEPAVRVLAPRPQTGWLHCGPAGSGHFVKMIHNGIEYGMMQALAEGLDLLRGKEEFDLNLAQITELWRHSSVVRSWLLDLTAEALEGDQKLDKVAPYVADSGEGRWTVTESIDQGVAAPVLTLALQMRFASQDERGYAFRLLSLMRNAFGGHAVKGAGEQQ